MKTEKFFPLNTIGGRIQRVIKDNNMSKRDLYVLVKGTPIFNKDDNSENVDAMSRAVLNWYGNKNRLSIEEIQTICKKCNCSADYLLCGIEETTMDVHQICKKIGLSEKAVQLLMKQKQKGSAVTMVNSDGSIEFKEFKAYRNWLDNVSFMITDKTLMDSLQIYLNADYEINSVDVQYEYGENQIDSKSIGKPKDMCSPARQVGKHTIPSDKITITNLIFNKELLVTPAIIEESAFNNIRKALDSLKKRIKKSQSD